MFEFYIEIDMKGSQLVDLVGVGESQLRLVIAHLFEAGDAELVQLALQICKIRVI